jgi:hypothetical protein
VFPADGIRQALERLRDRIADLEVISEEQHTVTLALSSASNHLPDIFQAITAAGGVVNETSLRSPNLETLFLLLTGKELRE